MIEINLLPGSVKRTKRKAGGLSAAALPKINLPPMDKYILSAIGMWIVAILMIVWMQFSSSSKLEAATNEEAKLVRDTAQAHKDIVNAAFLIARQDTISQKLKVIQELDAGRFDLAHILDEIGRTVPDYTWLVGLVPAEGGTPDAPAFRIEGRMGNPFALPKFITDLESSPFVSNVTLKKQQPVVENNKPLYMFSIEGTYQQPSADMIQTVPLFTAGSAMDSALSSLPAPDSTMDAAAAAAAVNAAGGAVKPGTKAPGKTQAKPPAKPPAKAAPGKATAKPPAVKKAGK
jgi:Tfp pilus assembly protein PilN